MPRYNNNSDRRYRNNGFSLDRFSSDSIERKERGLNSLGAFNEVVRASGGLGSFSTLGTEGAFGGKLADAEKEKNRLQSLGGNYQETDEYKNVQGLLNNAYKGVAPDDWAKKASNFAEQNMGTLAKEGTGMLGKLFGKSKLGQTLKAKGAELAASTLGKNAVAAYGAGSAILGPAVALKQLNDFTGQTIDRYEGLEEGIATGNLGLADIKSERRQAKSNLLSANRDISDRVQENRGKLTKQIGGKAEQVLTAAESMIGKTNIENSDSSNRTISTNKEGLNSAFIDNSQGLARQAKAGQLKNLDSYANINQGLIGRSGDLQAQVDALDEERKGMKGLYQISNMIHI